MLTAQEAKQLTFNNIENGETEEIKMILELINKAIKEGEYEIIYNNYLRKETIEYFKNLGYFINKYCRYSIFFYVCNVYNINWKNIKEDL